MLCSKALECLPINKLQLDVVFNQAIFGSLILSFIIPSPSTVMTEPMPDVFELLYVAVYRGDPIALELEHHLLRELCVPVEDKIHFVSAMQRAWEVQVSKVVRETQGCTIEGGHAYICILQV